MNSIFYTSLTVLCVFGSIWFLLKILDWIKSYKALRFDNNRSWFLSQLYKLAKQCAEIGEFEYAETLNDIIRINSVNTEKRIGKIGTPITNDALSTEIMLKNQRREEFREFSEEFIG